MNKNLKTKLRSYFSDWERLEAHYQELTQSAGDPNLKALYDLDKLHYSHIASKSYYDKSKSKWPATDYEPLNNFDDFVSKIEADLPVDDLYDTHKGLQTLRRHLRDNATEGGKITNTIMNSSADPMVLKTEVDQLREELSLIAKEGPSAKAAVQASRAKVKSTVRASGASKQTNKSQGSLGDNNGKSTQSKSQSFDETKQATGKPLQSMVAAEESAKDTGASHPEPGVHAKMNTEKNIDPQLINVGTTTPASNNSRTRDVFEIGSDSTIPFKKPRIESSSRAVDGPRTLNTTRGTPLFQTGNVASESSKLSIPTIHTQSTEKVTDTASSNASYKALPTDISKSQNSVSSQEGPKQFIFEGVAGLTQPFNAPLPNLVSTEKPSKNTITNSRGLSPAPINSFAQFSTWNKDNVTCIVNAAALHPEDPTIAIRDALRERFKVEISLDDANMLQSHYGLVKSTMDKYDYYIQTFRSIASKIRKNRSQYVTVPWAEMRNQMTAKTRLDLEDWDIKGRYHLFLLHHRVFGNDGEPAGNYRDSVDGFRKKYQNRVGLSVTEKNKAIYENQRKEAKNSTDTKSLEIPATTKQTESPQSSEKVSQNVHLSQKNQRNSSQSKIYFEKPQSTKKPPQKLNVPENIMLIPQEQATDVSKSRASPDKTSKSKLSETESQSAQPPSKTTSISNLPGSQLKRPKSSANAPQNRTIPENNPQNSQPKVKKVSTTNDVNDGDDIWTPELFEVMVNGYFLIPKKTPNKPLVLAEIIRLQTHVNVGVDRVLEKLKTVEFLNAVRSRNNRIVVPTSSPRPENNKMSTYSSLLRVLETETKSDSYYQSRIQSSHLTEFWDFEKTRCIMSTVEYADRFPANAENAEAIKKNTIFLILWRCLREFHVKVELKSINARLKRMMELDMFSESESRLLNAILHGSS